MKRILTTLVLGSILIWTSTDIFAEPTTLTGTVTKVRDGDTIEVGKVPIRLSGVSAPEMNEPLGPQSKAFMIDLVMGKHVRCELDGSKTHDRFVGICYLDEQDIGASLIANGLALDCPRYSGGRYTEYEIARAAARMKLPGYCQPQPI